MGQPHGAAGVCDPAGSCLDQTARRVGVVALAAAPMTSEVRRSREGQAAVEGQAATTAAPPLTSEEALQQAQAEGLTLRVADNKTGYLGVSLCKPGQPKPYQAKVSRGGKPVNLGCFATAEEAALCVARSPEGRAAAGRVAAGESQGTVPAMLPGAFSLIGALQDCR